MSKQIGLSREGSSRTVAKNFRHREPRVVVEDRLRHASMPIKHDTRLAKCSRNFARVSFKPMISPVSISTQYSWNGIVRVNWLELKSKVS